MPKKLLIFIVLLVAVLVSDQASKIWIYTNVAYGTEEIPVIDGFFSLVHAQNPGAAFGFLRNAEYRTYFFLGFTLFAVVIILDLLRKLPNEDRFVAATLGLIMGGAVGNAIDRLHKGTVTDFLRIYTDNESLRPWLIERFGTNEWPSFNIADSALVIGVGMFLIHYLFLEEAEDEDEKEPSPADAPAGAAVDPAETQAES